MAAEYQRLEGLVALAKEPSSERRRLLLREITDVFVEAPSNFSEKEVAEISAIMSQVAFDLEMTVRQELAERLADIPEAPHPLIAKLANAEIEVARPVLRQSGVLESADLLAIIKDRGQDYLLAVSQRRAIDSDVADALVEKGDDRVLVSLAGNTGAALSRGAMETMVIRSEGNIDLHAPLVTRHDLPPDLMHEMYWWVSSALREHIMTSTANIDEETIDAILRDTEKALATEKQDVDKQWVQPRLFIREQELNDKLTPAFVVELMRRKKPLECAAGFANLAGLDEETAHRLLSQGDAEALAIACRAGGFDRQAFSNLMLLMGKGGTHKEGAKFELLHLYEKMTEAAAKRAIRFWRTRRRAPARQAAPAGDLAETSA